MKFKTASVVIVSSRNCPSCGDPFKKDEPYPDVESCERCERFGPPKGEDVTGMLFMTRQYANGRK